MEKFWSKKKEPTRPGNYWVVLVLITSTGESHYTDDGYARWDGTKWDRVDWDHWYGTAKVQNGDVK